MSHSSVLSTLSAAQEAHAPERPAGPLAANAGTISDTASAGWAQAMTLSGMRGPQARTSRSNNALIELLSENPDRGHADKRTNVAKRDERATSLWVALKGNL